MTDETEVWIDTEVCIIRSFTARDVWVGVVPTADLMSTVHTAGKMRVCREATLELAGQLGYIDSVIALERLRWVTTVDGETQTLEELRER